MMTELLMSKQTQTINTSICVPCIHHPGATTKNLWGYVSTYRLSKEYAFYDTEEMIFMGSITECSMYLGITVEMVEWYASKACWNRIQNRNTKKYRIAVRVDSEDKTNRDWK